MAKTLKFTVLRGNSGDTGAGNWIGDVNGNTLGEWGFTEVTEE